MKNEALGEHTIWEMLKQGRNPRREEVLSENRVFGRWKDSFCREIERNEI